nr:amidohydrolase family protein [Kibdelosporangium sp. MJ126-NF4]CEL23108.1 tolB protein precursor, periplasmic protein involved in the tonb-independent uptake of group A colicins [Kibdelosporangium sp. MJ126-NF4]CTQ90245.1 tolB protein precursor, periplasmic protein involved in the tonb-independent uptake of group A colicins [Kibdelosporangium sp. MJ126-NF4]
MKVSRLALVCAVAFAPVTVAPVTVASAAQATTTVTVNEGTNFAVTVSPKDGTIVMDLQGQLFSLPRDGGVATRLGDDFLDPFWPVFSPDGGQIAVQSFADGMFHIRAITPDGRSVRQLTDGEYDDLYPAWSPDGTRIAFTSDRAGGADIWTVDVRTREVRRITTAATQETQPTWSPDGQSIAYVQGTTIESVDLATSAVRTVVPAERGFVSAPSWSPDGRRLAFGRNGSLQIAESGAVRQVGPHRDVFPFPARWLSTNELLYSANGRIAATDVVTGASRTVPFSATFSLKRDQYPRKHYDFDTQRPQPVRGIDGPSLSPDGRSVVFKALNDVWLLPVGDSARRLTSDAFFEADPAWSADGKHVAYASDKAGTEDLYVLDLAAGRERRVTSLPGAETAPVFSPDGRKLAFQDHTGQTSTVDLSDGTVARVIGPLNAPGKPSWSPDGKLLALTVSDADRNRIMLADTASGATRIVDPAPFGSVSTRGSDGPVWSPDGRLLAFSMNSTIHVLPVDSTGTPTGPARQVTHEASDSPSWSGDAKTLLYLHNGLLRTTTVEGKPTGDVPTGLTFVQDKPDTRLVVHAGRLWDGRHAEPRTDVDIIVVGNRIRRVEPHRADRDRRGWQFVDASALTVTPGLVDMHMHQEMRAKFTGDRQGRLLLSYGITTTRSTGDPAYRAVEDRESLSAGTRVGPRFFMTGEMLEGSRVGWEFARPVRDERQLELEWSRVRGLGYDLVKTYERFRVDWQAQTAGRAHRLGIPTTSHYLHPAVANGVDMKEHLSGPTKWGFGFSRESSAGGVYDDVIQLAARGRMPFSTTMFSASSLLADDPGILGDPRVRALYTTAEQQALLAKLLCAQGKGPCGFLDGTPEQARRDVGTIKRLLDAGGTVVAGTDAPLDSTAVSLHLNLRAMAKYGISPFEALHSATLLPARELGVERDLGSVEAGKLADLVFTEGDASRDITRLADVRMVMKNGRLSTVESLTAPFRP